MDTAGTFSLRYQKLPGKAQWKVKEIIVPWHTDYEWKFPTREKKAQRISHK